MTHASKLILSTAVLASSLLVNTGAHADTFLGGTLEASYWQAGVGGDATAFGSSVNMEDDLGFGSDSFTFFAASFEHIIPVVPNIRVEMANIDQTDNGTIGTLFDGVSGAVNTKLDLSHLDLILYYEILDNWVSLDVGFDVKKFDGKLSIDDGSNQSLTDIDAVLPLLYGSAEIELPLTDLSFGASVSGATYSGNSIYDARVRLRQGISLAFIELGYRTMAAKIDDLDDTDVDIDLSGAYLSVGLDF